MMNHTFKMASVEVHTDSENEKCITFPIVQRFKTHLMGSVALNGDRQ